MTTSFNEKFDQHGAWRREFALRLKLLSDWMKDHELLDAAVGHAVAVHGHTDTPELRAGLLQACRTGSPPA